MRIKRISIGAFACNRSIGLVSVVALLGGLGKLLVAATTRESDARAIVLSTRLLFVQLGALRRSNAGEAAPAALGALRARFAPEVAALVLASWMRG